MFSLNDVKFVAECQYDVNDKYKQHEVLVEEIINIIDTFYMLENMKLKETELMKIIDD
jgi:hypothetical protein